MQEIISDTSKFWLSANQNIYKISHRIERRVRNYLLNHVKKPGLITDLKYKICTPMDLTLELCMDLWIAQGS